MRNYVLSELRSNASKNRVGRVRAAHRFRISIAILSSLFSWIDEASAFDLPGGQLWTGNRVTPDRYEWSLSRSFQDANYWASRLRLSTGESSSLGIAFGAGVSSFHLGAEGAFHLNPPTARPFSMAWVSGVYFRRVTPESFAVLRTGPVTSIEWRTENLIFHPYVGVYTSPSWRLSDGKFEVNMRSVIGHMLQIRSAADLQIWTEGSFGLDSYTELTLGVAFPFAIL